jgi:DNA-directed RNA polymerase subunit L
MNVEVVESDKSFVKLKFDGDAHTILNLIKKKLLDDKSVSFAGYNKPHPLVNESFLVVKAKKGSPEKLIKSAIDNIIKDLDSLKIK